MVIVSDKINPTATWEFEAEILVLHHPTTISVNYQAMGKFYFNYFFLENLKSFVYLFIIFKSSLREYQADGNHNCNVT